MNSDISVILKNKRKSLGLRQSDIAKAVGKSLVFIQKLEQGKINPPIRIVQDIANAYDIDAEIIVEKLIKRLKTLAKQ